MENVCLLKWMGNKNYISATITDLMPEKIENYYEPFFGSGAVFYQCFRNVENTSYLSDNNPYLISLYNNLIDDPIYFANQMVEFAKHDLDEPFYYEQRSKYNNMDRTSKEASAILLYMNRVGFNGLYNDNLKGEYNVSYGRKPLRLQLVLNKILYLYKISKKYNITFDCMGFEDVNPCRNSVIFCDPPYLETSKLIYNKDKFGIQKHELLRDKCLEWSEHSTVMIINYDTPSVRKFYSVFDTEPVVFYKQTTVRKDYNSESVPDKEVFYILKKKK